MFDINLIRNKNEKILKKIKDRGFDISKIDQIIKDDEEIRMLLTNQQDLSAKRNSLSSEISSLIKDNNKDKIDIIKNEVSAIKESIEKLENKINILKLNIKSNLELIPNICDDSVPIGKDEKENIVIKKFSEPNKFSFDPKAHWDLGENLDLFIPSISTKITGSRFITYWKEGARLYRALQQFTLNENICSGFVEVLPQVIINDDSLYGTGQLPKFKDDLFKLENSDYYLSPTAEVQLTNIFRDTILKESDLPKKMTANTACFRSEAGSAGRDTRGVIRLHQFHKTELVIISHPDKSEENLEIITRQAESILEKLKLPYRRLLLCSGDTGFSSNKTYDIEVWLPSYNDYKEISSCSNCLDFQARRSKIRYKDNDGTNKFVHTLNGSSLAIDRLWVAVVENYQNSDGSITIPDILQQYMNGHKKIIK